MTPWFCAMTISSLRIAGVEASSMARFTARRLRAASR
jgi:hypothetical protein